MKQKKLLLFAAAATLTLSALTGCAMRTVPQTETRQQTGTNGSAVRRLSAGMEGTQSVKPIKYPEIELTYDQNGRVLELEGVNDKEGIFLADFPQMIGKDSQTALQTLIRALDQAKFFHGTPHLILELERETVDPKAEYQTELAAKIRETLKTCGLPENSVMIKTENPLTGVQISAEQAKSIARTALQRHTKTYDRVVCELDDGVYEIEFLVGRYSYEYEIDAATGIVLDEDIDIDDAIATPAATFISAEQAKSIARTALQRHTKTYDRVVCKLDDGVYEIEFTAGRYSYEYEVDAATGIVLDEDIDDEWDD